LDSKTTPAKGRRLFKKGEKGENKQFKSPEMAAAAEGELQKEKKEKGKSSSLFKREKVVGHAHRLGGKKVCRGGAGGAVVASHNNQPAREGTIQKGQPNRSPDRPPVIPKRRRNTCRGNPGGNGPHALPRKLDRKLKRRGKAGVFNEGDC